MQQFLNATTLANAIRMHRSASSHLFFLVEGKDDRLALEPQVNSHSCNIVSGNGKPTVVGAMQKLRSSNASGESDLAVVALVDRDYDDDSIASSPEGIAVTDLCDRETDSLVLGGLLNEYIEFWADIEDAAIFSDGKSTAELHALHIDAANSIGCLRRVSRDLESGLNMAKFPASNVIQEDLSVDVDDMIQIAISRTDECSYTVAEIRNAYTAKQSAVEERLNCNGHDLVSIISSTSERWSKTTRTRRDVSNYVIENTSIDVLDCLQWPFELQSTARDLGFSLWKTELTQRTAL